MASFGRISIPVLVSISLLTFFNHAYAADQSYPVKPVRIVTTEAGNSTDYLTRLLAHELSTVFSQQFIVDNRGIIAGQITAKANPDGYTLISYGSPLWLAPFMQDHVAYDPAKDFAAITLTNRSPNLLVVNPGVPVKSVNELLALAKAKPDGLNYASGSSGSSSHLAAELFKAMAGVKIVRIPYKGTGPAMNDLIGGQVQLMFASAGAVVQQVKSGRIRALAITSLQPSEQFPGIPTVAASVPGYESVSPFGLFAPANTPQPIIMRLNQEIVRVLHEPEIRNKFLAAGVEPVGSTPQQFADTVRSEMSRLGKLIKDAGIRDE